VYSDIAVEVLAFLDACVRRCERAGIGRNRLLVDPGFGFGKTDTHNLALLASLEVLQTLGLPVLVGLSRKRTLGNITGRAVDARTAAGLAAAVLAVERGATIIRTHDVAATADALKMVAAVREMAAANKQTG
jgi:dihydropteroate synthase